MKRTTRLVTLLGAVLGAAVLGAVAGWARWSSTGSGAGEATVGTLAAATNLTASQPTPGVGTVRLAWTAPAGQAVDGYRVQRTGASAGNACATSANVLVTSPTCDDTGLAAGTYSYTVTAVWRSWTATSESASITVTTKVDTTTAVVSTTGSPSVAGQLVTYTATVSVTAPGTGTPTGNVEFLDAGSPINVCGGTAGNPLASGGATATCTVNYSSPTSRTITARYLGDSTYTASPASTAITQVVNKATPTTELTITGSPATYGSLASVSFAATVSAPHSGTPTGSVAIRHGTTTLCTISLPASSCAPGATALSAGASPYAVTAVYSGDANFATSTSTARDLTVNKANLTITASSGTMTYGTAAPAITASYAGFVGGEGTANLTTLPSCSTTATATSPVGTYASNCAGAAAANYAFTYVAGSVSVTQASQAITFTSTAPSTAAVGGTYTVTATGGGSGNPVTFAIDATAAGVCSVSGSTVSFTAAGTCRINANQAGGTNYSAAPQAQQSFSVATAPVINTVVRSGGNKKVNFTGTGAAGSSITITICRINAFPCATANVAGTSTVTAVPSNGSWTSAQSGPDNLELSATYYAQAVQTGPSATSATFQFSTTNL